MVRQAVSWGCFLERSARDALARTALAAPETGPERAALRALLAVRCSTVDAATTA